MLICIVCLWHNFNNHRVYKVAGEPFFLCVWVDFITVQVKMPKNHQGKCFWSSLRVFFTSEWDWWKGEYVTWSLKCTGRVQICMHIHVGLFRAYTGKANMVYLCKCSVKTGCTALSAGGSNVWLPMNEFLRHREENGEIDCCCHNQGMRKWQNTMAGI